MAGDEEEARRLLSRLSEISAGRYVPSTCFALVHAGLGENDRALSWLERGADEHELPMIVLGVHPIYDTLRGEPRFAAVLQRLRLDAIQTPSHARTR
jgi:serine/threonine-protein kinase